MSDRSLAPALPTRHRWYRASTVVCTALFLLTIGQATADPGPMLGTELDAATVQLLSQTVYPDGSGLPTGSGTGNQGEPLYSQHCQACHGVAGVGGINAALAGGTGSLASAEPQRTVGSYWPYATTLFDYIRRAMPYNAVGTLDDDELYAITAYILSINGIVDANAPLDAMSLPKVIMPNRNGFRWPSQPATRETSAGANANR